VSCGCRKGAPVAGCVTHTVEAGDLGASSFRGMVPKPTSPGGVSRKKPAANKRTKAGAKRWEQLRAAKCRSCRVCGTTSGHIHAHHLIRQGTDLWLSSDTENNLVGLCGQCHTDLHAGRDTVKKILRFNLTADEVEHTDMNAYTGYVDDVLWRVRPVVEDGRAA
jgi:hypothetical protein